ncbi:DUF2218 domain-containing protein [Nakamurella sp.]|uniref:DUF2218 domain-containing protein n=1 Tax=Nakamurella sp. TaxID=1869182 RepID=UPI003B3B2F89
MLVSVAVVDTDAPARYAKQLLSHLGRKVAVEPVPGQPEPAGRLVFAYGFGDVLPGAAALELRATAADNEALARVQDVLARHLVRFGARRELEVTWGSATGDAEPGPPGPGAAGPADPGPGATADPPSTAG